MFVHMFGKNYLMFIVLFINPWSLIRIGVQKYFAYPIPRIFPHFFVTSIQFISACRHLLI